MTAAELHERAMCAAFARDDGPAPLCRECDRLRAENATLRAQVRDLGRLVSDAEQE